MSGEPVPSLRMGDLMELADFHLGSLFVSPSRRVIKGPLGARTLQPQVMAVFICLALQPDRVVSRRSLFERCWGNAPVGDDSLNRVLSNIRNQIEAVGIHALSIETIPRTGYRLLVGPGRETAAGGTLERAVEAAQDCWRAGIPKADEAEIEALAAELGEVAGAREWGVYALLLRKAAEYAQAADCSEYVARCQQAARRALAMDPAEGNARVALTGLVPLFGNWPAARTQLLANLDLNEGHVATRHELAVLEMATGRPTAAIPLIERLIAEDGLAATFHYKRMYHLWCLGDLAEAEKLAARALQLWPRHPAIWAARFWTLLFTGRSDQAAGFASDEDCRPALPPPAIDFLCATASLVSALEAGEAGQDRRSDHVRRSIAVAALGPANAVSALLSLCALDAIDEAFQVARGYYLGEGPTAVPLRWSARDPSFTDQHRRVTQPLFIPAARRMREDERFLPLCRDIGLEAYWREFALEPDFLRS